MSKDSSDYKKTLLPFKKNGNNNNGKLGSLEDKKQGQATSEDQKETTKRKK